MPQMSLRGASSVNCPSDKTRISSAVRIRIRDSSGVGRIDPVWEGRGNDLIIVFGSTDTSYTLSSSLPSFDWTAYKRLVRENTIQFHATCSNVPSNVP